MLKLVFSLILVGLLFFPTIVAAEDSNVVIEISSPNGQLRATFKLGQDRQPQLEVSYRGFTFATGELGLEFAGSGELRKYLKVVSTKQTNVDETYAIAVGKTSSARDRHHEWIVSLEEIRPPHRKLEIALRAFDDGIAFQYRLPEQEALREFTLTDELTRLTFVNNPQAKLLPLGKYTTPYEKYYETKPLGELGADQLIGLPMLLDYAPKLAVAVTEANLTDYAGMYLASVEGEPGTVVAKLSPLPGRMDRAKVVGKTSFKSPWRVLMAAENPLRLIESNIIFHLSDPPAIKDTSWIKPGKTTFPWWNHYVLEGVDFQPGVNTATMKHYLDFCAEQGIPYHSLDGLDIAWYGGPIRPNGPTDVTTAAPSIDMPELLRYAKAKGVRLRLWMHWKALQPQIDEAFKTYEAWGIEGVMVDFMDRDDQEMVRFYHEMAAKAAKHHLTVSLHGAYKPTGMERTWPNVLTYEAALNQEYNKWQPAGVKGTPPQHNLDIAFVRMLAGPLDYHQGGMRNVLPENYRFRDVAPPVQGTRCHQLAMYVVYQNHLPMLADYPAAYRGQPGLAFLVDVPTTWDETRVLRGKLDRFLVIARRRGDAWYLGGMTASNPQELQLPLDFLGDGSYSAELYLDDPTGEATSVIERKQSVRATDELNVALSPSGGFAARIVKVGSP